MTKDTNPDDYQRRCIRMDAERAAKMGETAEKACSYAPTSWQSREWYDAFATQKLRMSEARSV